MTHASTAPTWVDRNAYPFEPHWFALRSGTRMHYVDEGRGPTVLFVHGTPTWSFEWRRQIRALAPHFRCIAPDLVGMGLSDRPADFGYTPEAHARALAEFVEGLDLRNVALVVHDFGGPIGLPLALDDHSRIDRVVIVNTFGWSLENDADIRRPARLFGGALGRWLYTHAHFSLRVILPAAYADKHKLTPATHAQYLAPFADKNARGLVLHAFARALLGASAHYRALDAKLPRLRRTPVLIIWGTKDPAFRETQLTRWIDTFPQAHVVRLPVGHWPHEEAPDEFNAALHSFLDDEQTGGDSDANHTSRAIEAPRRRA